MLKQLNYHNRLETNMTKFRPLIFYGKNSLIDLNRSKSYRRKLIKSINIYNNLCKTYTRLNVNSKINNLLSRH